MKLHTKSAYSLHPTRTRLTRKLPLPIVLGGLVLATCGCQVLTYTGPTGETFSRATFGASTAIASLQIETETNGIRRVELKGYQNDSTQALQAVTEAAVRAAVRGAQ